MKAFRGLIQKEWLIGKTMLLWLLLAQVGFVFIAYFLAKYMDAPGLFYFSSSGILMMQPMIIIFLILNALHSEGKTQLWLHSPQSSGLLLGSKVLVSVLFQMISFMFACGLTLISLSIPTNYFQEYFQVDTVMRGIDLFMLIGNYLVICIFISILVVFLWVIYHALARISAIKKIRWLVVTLLFACMTMLGYWFESSSFYQWMDDIWVVEGLINVSFEMTDVSMDYILNTEKDSLLTSGLDILSLVLFFLASCWLMDRKLEV